MGFDQPPAQYTARLAELRYKEMGLRQELAVRSLVVRLGCRQQLEVRKARWCQLVARPLRGFECCQVARLLFSNVSGP